MNINSDANPEMIQSRKLIVMLRLTIVRLDQHSLLTKICKLFHLLRNDVESVEI